MMPSARHQPHRSPCPGWVAGTLRECWTAWATVAIAAALVVGGSSFAWGQFAPDHIRGELLIQWAPSASEATRAHARDRVAGVTRQHFRALRWEHVQIDPTLDVATAVQRMRQQPGVVQAEPVFRRSVAALPNDPMFPLQWALRNTGQTVNGIAGTPGADISATSAWDLRRTAPAVIVAVIDTGIALTHPDLAPNVWTNPGETPNNGNDDDGNGFVDDVHGWNFITGTNEVADDHGHGTFVAGVIGARGNDGAGAAGVAWAITLMVLKTGDSQGIMTVADVIAAVQYATRMGAHIINASWAGTGFSQAEKEALEAFPGLVVNSAGNGASNIDTAPVYPAALRSPNLIVVAASDQHDALDSTSNFGPGTVHLAAPGVNIVSDFWTGGVGIGAGTSFSAALVTGVAALLHAQDPTRPMADIKATILSTVDAKASLAGKVATGGRLNAQAALAAFTPPPPGPTGTTPPDPAPVTTADAGGGGGGGCFIATAAFGSPLAAEVQTFRQFRDEFLLTNGPGRLLARAYSRLSPRVAALIAHHERLRWAARLALSPVLGWVHLMGISPVLGMGLVALLAVSPGIPWFVVRARRRRDGAALLGLGVALLLAAPVPASAGASSADVRYADARWVVVVRDLPGQHRRMYGEHDQVTLVPGRPVRILRVDGGRVHAQPEAQEPRWAREGDRMPGVPGSRIEAITRISGVRYQYVFTPGPIDAEPRFLRLEAGQAVLEIDVSTARALASPATTAPHEDAAATPADPVEALIRRMAIHPTGLNTYEVSNRDIRVLLDLAGPILASTTPEGWPALSLSEGVGWHIDSAVANGVLGPQGFRVVSPKLAERAGINVGDVILSVNGQTVGGMTDLLRVYRQMRQSCPTIVRVELERDGQLLMKTYRVR
jgi:subtilisin family serine protease